jgi:cell division protein FtsW
MDRLTVFLHPELDPRGIGYQINQALLAIGSGGFLGLGLGHSLQKFNYLPEPVGDSIFAIIGEELGMIGAGILILLFVFFAMRGLRIARNAPDRFSRLVAAGIVSWIIFQAFINISAICGLIPLTGIPLPFISYGGTSIVFLMTGVGILLNISKYSQMNG